MPLEEGQSGFEIGGDCLGSPVTLFSCLSRVAVPHFLAPGTTFVEDSFSTDCAGDGLRIQVHCICWALYVLLGYYYITVHNICYYCISSTSDHQALDPRG